MNNKIRPSIFCSARHRGVSQSTQIKTNAESESDKL